MEKKPNRGSQALKILLGLCCLLLAVGIWQRAAAPTEELSAVSPLRETIDKTVQAKWDKPFSQLPVENLIIVSPHNDEIRKNFEHEFVRHYAVEHGRRVLIWWHQPGGSNAILDYVPLEPANETKIQADVIFGGGEYVFQRLAQAGRLEPLTIPEETLAQIPRENAGLALRDPQCTWCGNVLSSFGILYNRSMLEACGMPELSTWSDLASPRLFDNLVLADPTVSGSTMMAIEMVLQSGPDWPGGWARLLSILSNARAFVGNSDDAANAPLFDQAAATICIDFYGISRAAYQPDKLVYVSPAGQTAFTPDPVAILKDAPHAETARAFVAFLLSMDGQKIWGLQKKASDPLNINALYRSPVRKDFYTACKTELPQWALNPYESESMQFDPELRSQRYPVLIELIRAAAIDNFSAMHQARRKLIEQGESAAASEFVRLPENADTLKEILQLNTQFQDPQVKEAISAEWKEYFQTQYEQIIGSEV